MRWTSKITVLIAASELEAMELLVLNRMSRIKKRQQRLTRWVRCNKEPWNLGRWMDSGWLRLRI